MRDQPRLGRFWQAVATNYLRVALRLVGGVVLFRLTFQHLDPASFGLYSLLWSVFGFAVLLDFGLGFTAQKAVAEHAVHGRIEELNRLVCTVLWCFAGTGFLLFVTAFFASPYLVHKSEADSVPQAVFACRVFFAGMAIGLPAGIFPEMLRGLQRIDLANWLSIGGLLVNLVLMSIGLLSGWPLPALIGIGVFTSVAPAIAAIFLVRRSIPGLSLHPRHVHLGSLKGVLGFSIVAYLISFTNLIMARTDQAILGLTLGVASIAIYQAGGKLAEMFSMGTLQMQDALTPAAARLNQRRDAEGLRALVVGSTRLAILISIPLCALGLFHAEAIIRLLTNLKEVSQETMTVAQALLLAACSSVVTNSCSKRVMMMCGHERVLLGVSALDAVANVIVSLVLVRTIGVAGVAIGTLVPTMLVGWFLMLPLTLRFVGLDLKAYTRSVLTPLLPAFGAGVAAAVLSWLAISHLPGLPVLAVLALHGAAVGAAMLLPARKLMRELTS